MTGVVDQFFVALGFKTDTSGLKEMQKNAEAAKSSMLSIGASIGAVLGTLAVKGIAEIGSAWESNRIQIAGYFTALGQSTDFTSALGDADRALNLITIAAAKLPGEAEEYQEVFKDTFTFVKGAVGGTIEEMTTFTNTLTAIGKAGKIDAAQIGRETNELLAAGAGRAMGRNRLWMQLFPLMRQLDGQAKLTSQSFNAMTEAKRADLMKRAFAGLQPMLDASAGSFDAMWGAMKSGLKILVRLGTSGLFEGMKSGLEKLNALFFDTAGAITKFGQSIVDNTKAVGGWVTDIVATAGNILFWLLKFDDAGKTVAITVGIMAAQFLGLRRVIVGPLLAAFALLAEDLFRFVTGTGESVTGLLVSKWKPAIYAVTAAFIGLALVIFGPTVVAIALVVAAGVAMASKWQEIVDGMSDAWQEFKDNFTEGFMKRLTGDGTILGVKVTEGQEERHQRYAKERFQRIAERNDSRVQARLKEEQEKTQKDVASGTDNAAGMSVPTDSGSTFSPGVVSYDPRAIGSGFGSVTDNSVTHVSISVDGSKDPEATARAIDKHLQRRDRVTRRNAQPARKL